MEVPTGCDPVCQTPTTPGARVSSAPGADGVASVANGPGWPCLGLRRLPAGYRPPGVNPAHLPLPSEVLFDPFDRSVGQACNSFSLTPYNS